MSGRRWESIFEALPARLLVVERPGGRVVGASRSFLELVGLPRDEVVGCEPPFPWWESPGAFPSDLGGDDTFVRVTGAYRGADGRRIPVQATASATTDPETGASLGLLLIDDLTESLDLEQQLVQSGRTAAVGQLAAGIAHEINNPLLVVLGMTEFLLMDAEPGSKQHERLELIQQTGLEIRDIVRGLVEFAREPADVLADVSVEDVLRSALALARRANLTKLVEVVERYPQDERLVVHASSNQLKQVFLNLLSNAQAACGTSGGTVVFDLSRSGAEAVVTVSDDGPGIDPQVLEHVFEPFYSTRRGAGASGLGLTVSRRIVEQHGGRLEIDSGPGRGTVCTVLLPLVTAP